MKFMPRSSATRTERTASFKSTGRNSCPRDEAPKLRTGSVRPVLPSERRSIGSIHSHADRQKEVGEALLVGGLDGEDMVAGVNGLVEGELLDRLQFQLQSKGEGGDLNLTGVAQAEGDWPLDLKGSFSNFRGDPYVIKGEGWMYQIWWGYNTIDDEWLQLDILDDAQGGRLGCRHQEGRCLERARKRPRNQNALKKHGCLTFCSWFGWSIEHIG